MTTVDILRQARTLIENEKDWRKGQLCDYAGRRCALGAVATVAFGSSVTHLVNAENEMYERLNVFPAVIALHRAVADDDQGYDPVDTVYKINDRGHHDRVLALFDRAIAVEESKAQEFDVAQEPVHA